MNYLCLDELKKELGSGGFGTVYLVEKKETHGEWVIKFVALGDKKTTNYKEKLKSIERDLTVGTTIGRNSPFLMKYIETFEEGGYYCIVMEYCTGGDLQSLLDKKKIFTESVYFIYLFIYYLLHS
jgi:NIMA (never in mitosis gene a)-related kinase